MQKFNNSNIFTGYLKQLLHDFKLPQFRVYTKENKRYFEKYGKELHIIESEPDRDNSGPEYPTHVRNIVYLRNDKFQKYVNGAWETINLGQELKKTANNYTRLSIKDQIYDSYTHDYLGRYLRYIRDMHNIDLMPLYNCFGYETPNELKIEIADGDKTTATFDSSDNNYKIYILPARFFQKYTIAIDCAKTVEICCCLYGRYQDKRSLIEELYKKTYFKTSHAIFSQPFVYDKLSDIDEFLSKESVLELGQSERDLKLVIKLPADNRSSITVLEGDYHNWNDERLFGPGVRIERPTHNRAIINFEADDDSLENLAFKPITKLQLLCLNTGESYPFADRLIEYLSDNAITDLDTISDNVARAQKILSENGNAIKQNGAWNDRMRLMFYDYMNQGRERNNISDDGVFHDMLGYVDKDVEKWYKSKNADGSDRNSLADIDIYPDLYLSDKKR